MRIIFILLVVTLVGCASTPSYRNYTDTVDLIEAAAEAAPKGVHGDYFFRVRASGTQRQRVYLNTELDYRDQRNITVALTPQVAAEFAQKYGQAAEDFFLNKSIQVKGSARRVKIHFYSQGKLTEKYYYQTHVPVTATSQINILP